MKMTIQKRILVSLLIFLCINVGQENLIGSTLTSPSGAVSSWGSAFFGLGGLTKTPVSDAIDGSFALGMGWGNPDESVGGAISLGIGSVNPFDGGLGERGYFSFNLGQNVKGTGTSWAVGFNNLFGWHRLSPRMPISAYFAMTQKLSFASPKYPLTFTFGLGNYTYANKNSPAINDAGFFAALGVQIHPRFNLIADHTGVATSAGISMMPIEGVPIAINLIAWDLFAGVTSHPNPSFMGMLAYSYTFK